jgi:hypothetical protein
MPNVCWTASACSGTRPCDLDLLIFFARHPRILLASEQLAVLLGYESSSSRRRWIA